MTTKVSKSAGKTALPAVSPVTPYLTCSGAVEAIEFYRRAFGAESLMAPLLTPDGKVMHACLSINGGSVMVSDEFGGMGTSPRTLGGSPVTVHLVVDDADAWVARARDAGATVTMPVAEQFWGDRFGTIVDPYGHAWSFSTPVRQLSERELRDAAQAAISAAAV